MKLNKAISLYGLLLSIGLLTLGTINTTSNWDLISLILFYPVTIFFAFEFLPNPSLKTSPPKQLSKSSGYLVQAKSTKNSQPQHLEPEGIDNPADLDIDKRKFLKLLGSAGVSLVLLGILPKRAEAAFFGSVPGPGVVALKDPSGNKIDPARNQPTDGYSISELDDATIPAYFGFTNKDSAWYIMREDATGGYRYVAGTSDFSTNWTNRASLTYTTFDTAF